jgi:hypothetical protein
LNAIGEKTFSFDADGLAHVGMLPDLIADFQCMGLRDEDLEPLLNSAEGYVRVWERCTNPRRIAVLNPHGDLSVKEGPLIAGWVLESSGVASFALEGDRIAVLAANGDLSVKEGPLDAGWVLVSRNVAKFALERMSRVPWNFGGGPRGWSGGILLGGCDSNGGLQRAAERWQVQVAVDAAELLGRLVHPGGDPAQHHLAVLPALGRWRRGRGRWRSSTRWCS